MKYYSQYGQDKYVYDTFFHGKKNGVFLEIGADDGVTLSNTKFFEERGWTGICIEPRPNAYQLLIRNRTCICENYAISDKEEEVPFLSIEGYGKGLSGIVNNYDPKHWLRANGNETISSKKTIIRVQCRKLEQILSKHDIGTIHFCSLDVEGSEMKILESIDFSRLDIKVFAIENNFKENKIRYFMEKHGYKLNKRLHIDDIFVKKSFIKENMLCEENVLKFSNNDYVFHHYRDKNMKNQAVIIDEKLSSTNNPNWLSDNDPQLSKLIRPNIRKIISGREYMIREIDPIDLLTPERFDIIAKVIYGKQHTNGIKTDWGSELYAAHLNVFNGCFEPDGTGKNSLLAFIQSFHKTLRSIELKGFDPKKSLIPVGRNNVLLDGAHRVAAAIINQKRVIALCCERLAFIYDYEFFKNYTRHVRSGLVTKWTDPMAMEYCSLKQNTYIVSLFPAAAGGDEKVREILKECGKIVYAKRVVLENYGPTLLMRQMYSGEPWLGDSMNRFAGAVQKAGLCFDRPGALRVYLLESDDPAAVATAKEKIRKIYHIGNHSVHINDSHAETLKLASIFFNENSLHFLNNARENYFENFHQLFRQYRQWIETQPADASGFCIDGSAVLAAYGLRQARDLDFLHFGEDPPATGNPLIESHNDEARYHVTHRDDILFNPENHFYYQGIKFASLSIIRALKEKRGEGKDMDDVALIDRLCNQVNGESRRAAMFAAPPKLVNIVYSHTRANGFSMHKGNTTVVWSAAPLKGCHLYAFQDAFSFTGRQPGINVLLMHEPLVVLPGQYDERVFDRFDHVLTSLDSLAEKSSKIKKFRHPVFDGPYDQKTVKYIDTGYRVPLEEKEDAICMISGNKVSRVPGELYSKRVEIATWFHTNAVMRFDVYGRPPFSYLANYLKELEPYTEKFATLARYRYSLCFENIYDPFWSKGYLTEKLPHCLMCGTVPIYLGCADIEDYVPPECFIDYRHFQDPGRLASFLEGLSDADYRNYLDNIDMWVKAGNLKSFSIHHTYDQLALLANPECKPDEVTSGSWQIGPAPEFHGSQLQVVASSPLWSWEDLAKKMPSPELLSGNFSVKPVVGHVPRPGAAQQIPKQIGICSAEMDAAPDVQHVYQDCVVGQASALNTEQLARQDRDWSDREWNMRTVPNPNGLIEINGVQGFLGQGDVGFLYKKAKSLPPNGVIVEIGSFMGLSAIVMGCGLRDNGNFGARIYCVDSWDNVYLEKVEVSDKRDLYDIFRENIARAGLESFIYPIHKKSLEAVADFAINSVDMLFIDGDHSFESCFADLNSWYQKVRPGGTILGHDCRPGQGVHKAVEKFKRECGQDYLVMPPPETNYMFEVKKEQLVSIIILNFNGASVIQKCIESIEAHTDKPYELIVVDNASTDSSLAYLRTLREITLVENPENLGCPPARAQAFALARGQYVVLLDNDTIVTPGWLSTFIEHAKANPLIGIMGPRSNYVSGPQIVLNVPYKDLHGLDTFAMQFSAQLRGHLTLTHRLVGFCMFIRREVIDKIGSIDASFGKFGFEDDDYTWRAQIAGFSAAIANDVFIHHTGGPQGRGSKQYNRLLMEAWQTFKRKWDLPEKLKYGSPFDVGNIVQRQFDPKRHYIQLLPRTSVEPLIYACGGQASSWIETSSAKEDLTCSKIQFKKKATSNMVSIIIPVAEHSKQLKKCIENIKKHTPKAHEIIFVDNVCKAGTLKWIRQAVKRKSNYRLIKAGKEACLGKCFNKGMAASTGEYIILIRDHVIVTDGWLDGMLKCLNKADDTGIIGPMTNAKAAGRQYVADSVHVGIDQLEEYAKAFHERNRHRRVSSREIPNFCMLFRRSLVEEIGPFDEELEQGGESYDYCLRAEIEGYKNLIAGDVFVLCGLLPPKGNKRFFDYKWRDIDAKSHNGERLGVLNAIRDAEKLYQREEVDKAIVKVIDGIGYSPDEEAIYHRLAEMLIGCERFKEGLDAINSIPEDKRDSARTLELTGYCRAGLELYDEAEQCAERALLLNGSSAPALNLMGVLAHIRGDKGASEDFFKRAIASDTGYGGAYTNLGVLEWEAGRKEEALEILEKGFILSPTVEDNRTAYLSAIAETAEFERAEGVFREAKALYPQNRRIAFLLIDILIRQEKYDSAMRDIREAMITFGINDGILSAAQAVLDRFDAQETKDIEKKTSLSLCMIVKDEEDCLARCLMSVMPVVDEIIIVDTGSTDRTKVIAKTYGAKVYDFEWTNDFSEARNFSLSEATGDWILVLDADETISALDYDRLINIVKNNPDHPAAYSITTRNYVKPPYVIGWTCNNGEYPDEEEGTGWYPSPKVRLFTNDSCIRFENLVHEIVEPSLRKNGIKIREIDIPVHHYGQLDREHYVAKGNKYYRLSKKKLEGKGEDLKALSELAVQAGGEFGKYEEAVGLWKRVLKIDPQNTKALVNMGGALIKLENYEAARTSSKMAMTLAPDLKEAVVLYATCEVLIGDAGKIILLLEKLLKEVPEYPLALAILAVAFGIEGERKKGLKQIRNITRMGFKIADYLQDMAERLISSGKTDSAVALLELAVESGKGTREIRELLDGLMIG